MTAKIKDPSGPQRRTVELIGEELLAGRYFVQRRPGHRRHIAGRSYGEVTTLCDLAFVVWHAQHRLWDQGRETVCSVCWEMAKGARVVKGYA